MRTLDEAIAEERAKADKARKSEAAFLRDGLIWNAKGEHRLAEEHEQLAEWLEELKAYRTLDKTNFSDGYNKAIDDFAEQLKAEYKPCEKTDEEIYKKVCIRIEKIAEQLKAGVDNV